MNAQLINHRSSVWQLSLDSSVVDLNVSIIICESLSCVVRASRKATGLMIKSVLYLLFAKQVFSYRGKSKILKEIKIFGAPRMRNYGIERRKTGARTKTQEENVYACV